MNRCHAAGCYAPEAFHIILGHAPNRARVFFCRRHTLDVLHQGAATINITAVWPCREASR